MTDSESTGATWLRSSGAGALVGLLYLLTLSRDWSGNSIAFALAAERGGLRDQIEPHVLLLAPLARAIWRVWQVWLPDGRAMLPLTAANAVSGGLIAACAHHIVLKRTGRPRLALWIALGLGVSNSAWLLSTSVEMVTPALALGMIALTALLVAPPERLRSARFGAGLGLLTAVAALTTQSQLLLVPTTILAWWKAGALTERRGRRALGTSLVMSLGGWMLAYGGTLYALGLRDLASLRTWRPHPGLGRPYGVLTGSDLPHAGYAFLRSLAGFPGLGLNDSSRGLLVERGVASPVGLAFLALYTLAALVAVWPPWLAWRHRAAIRARHGTALVALLAIGLLHAGFATWWLPGDLSFWLMVTVAWWLVAALAIDVADASADSPSGHRARREPSPLGLRALVLGLMTLNGLGLALPGLAAGLRPPSHHPVLGAGAIRNALAGVSGWPTPAEIGALLEDRVAPADLAIVIDDGRLFAGIYYATRGRASSPFQLLPGHPLSPEPLGAAARSKAEVARLLDAMIETTRARGGQVYLVGLDTADPRLWERLEPTGIDAALFEAYPGSTVMAVRRGLGGPGPSEVIRRLAPP